MELSSGTLVRPMSNRSTGTNCYKTKDNFNSRRSPKTNIIILLFDNSIDGNKPFTKYVTYYSAGAATMMPSQHYMTPPRRHHDATMSPPVASQQRHHDVTMSPPVASLQRHHDATIFAIKGHRTKYIHVSTQWNSFVPAQISVLKSESNFSRRSRYVSNPYLQVTASGFMLGWLTGIDNPGDRNNRKMSNTISFFASAVYFGMIRIVVDEPRLMKTIRRMKFVNYDHVIIWDILTSYEQKLQVIAWCLAYWY